MKHRSSILLTLSVHSGVRAFVLCASLGSLFVFEAYAQDFSGNTPSDTRSDDPSLFLSQTTEGPEVLQLKQRVEDLEFEVRMLKSKIEELSQRKTSERSGESKTPYLEDTETFETVTQKEIPQTSFEEKTPSEINRTPLSGETSDPAVPQPPPSSSSSLSPPARDAPSRVSEIPKAKGTEPPFETGDPRHLFDQAYSFLVQKNYALAQSGFRNFIKSYPTHSLVPNAVFWLGETHFGQGNYADAAEAFDLVLQGYGNSPKAPESLVKKGMSLAALGKKTEACTTLRKLSSQYPSSPVTLKTQAQEERSRMGCP